MTRLFPILLFAAVAFAGGGPETTLVVVNADSPLSRHVAHEYAALRGLPPGRMLLLRDLPNLGVVPLEFFLERVWAPIEAHLKEHDLEGRIDLVTYSADFFFGVDFRARLPKPVDKQIGGIASLTGATYLARQIVAGEEFWSLTANRYAGVGGGGRASPPRASPEERGHFATAMTALQQQRYDAAALAFEKLLASYRAAPQPWYNYACCLARLGRKEEALDALAQAATTGFTNAGHARRDPDLDSLRGADRFDGIVASMGGSVEAARAFRSAHAWGGQARYVLSTQLAFTGFLGNSRGEIERYLRTAAAADGTRPDGTVYFCRNKNVRSKTREGFAPALVNGLGALGRKAIVVDALVPVDKKDVLGAVVGIANFDWVKSGSRMLPGAICEHLTSHGGNFATPGQTKLTEFLRHGAAGASGTVMEPYAIHQKFPNPALHVFYAHGCSLAESFYRSVLGPYQLLVVGDGLARPFARFADVAVTAPATPWRGSVEIGGEFDELWLDGRLLEGRTIDTTRLEDGVHDLRAVAIADDRVATRSLRRIDAVVANHGAPPAVTAPGPVVYGDPIRVESPGARRLRVFCAGELVATADGASCEVASVRVGPGPVALDVRVERADDSVARIPVAVRVEAGAPRAAVESDRPATPALRGFVEVGGKRTPIAIANLGGRASGRGVRDFLPDGATRVQVEGEFLVEEGGLVQLAARGNGKLELAVGDRPLLAGELGAMRFGALALAPGWHPIRIDFRPHGAGRLELLVGGAERPAPPRVRAPSAGKRGPATTADAVPADGLVLSWKKTLRRLTTVTLHPHRDPGGWILETGRPGRWRPVKGVETLEARPARVPKNKSEVPLFVELTFPKINTRALRIRPADGQRVPLKKLQLLVE